MDLITAPPPLEATQAMAAIDGVRIFPAVLNTQTGPDGHLGPEDAGAILVLQGTFSDSARFAGFWQRAAAMMEHLALAPGFIRRCNFADGPHYTLIAWWRTVEDAQAFFASPAHQAAMRSTFEHRWNYTHFAGLWQVVQQRERLFFCGECDGITPAPARTCSGCGAELVDPFATTAEGDGGRAVAVVS